jgi:hypothetical protein
MTTTAPFGSAGRSACLIYASKTSVLTLLSNKAAVNSLSPVNAPIAFVLFFACQSCFPKHLAPSSA